MIVNLFRVTCDVTDCDEQIEVPKICRPQHWHMVDDRFLCPKHEVTVDGKRLPTDKENR